MTQSLYIAQDPNPIIILDFSFPLTSNPSANPINFMNIYPHTYIHHTFIQFIGFAASRTERVIKTIKNNRPSRTGVFPLGWNSQCNLISQVR